MKILISSLLVFFGGVCLVPAQVGIAPSPIAPEPATPTYFVSQRGPHHTIWERVEFHKNQDGSKSYARTNHYVELADGLNVEEGTNGFRPSRETIEILPTGSAAALQGQYRAWFPADIYEGVIEIETPDGKRLKSRPAGVSYFNGTESVLIAELKNSLGQLLPSGNQIVWPDCLTGISADLVVTYRKGGIECDLIFRESPPGPQQWGLANARLQLLTEFFDTESPVMEAGQPDNASGLRDNTLRFGSAMNMPSGKAYSVANSETGALPETPNARNDETQVFKSWEVFSDSQDPSLKRTFLIEEVPYERIEQELRKLPSPNASISSSSNELAATGAALRPLVQGLVFPRQYSITRGGQTMQLASADLHCKPGYVWDWLLNLSSGTTYTLQGDTTYYLSSPVSFSGTVTFEAGTCLKYASGAELSVGGIDWMATEYRPVIFTSLNDDSIGEVVSGSTGDPTGNLYANPALSFNGMQSQISPDLSHLRISYAQRALSCGYASFKLRHSQIVNCFEGIAAVNAGVALRDVLFARVQKCLYLSFAGATGENVTFDATPAIGTLAYGYSPYYGVTLTNCIVANMNWTDPLRFSGDHNAFFNSGSSPFGTSPITVPVYPFQTVGAGNYYLIEASDLRNQGLSTIDPELLMDLKRRTTYPPAEISQGTISEDTTLVPATHTATINPDMGYHYPRLDHLMQSITIQNATLTIQNGAAIGITSSGSQNGIVVGDGGKLVAIGSPRAPNHIVRYTAVQEQSSAGTSGIGGLIGTDLSSFSGEMHLQSTVLAGQHSLVSAHVITKASFRDCEFYSGSLTVGANEPGMAIWATTNCLLQRVRLFVTPLDFLEGFFYNNLFFEGSVETDIPSTTPLHFKDNFFYRTLLYDYSCTLDRDYNAYITGHGWSEGFGDWVPTGNDVVLGSYTFGSGAFGPFYQPSDELQNQGSRTAADAGLYHYTVLASQQKAGELGDGKVSIGLHYLALDEDEEPIDADGDTLPDYVEDSNGNGSYQITDLSDWGNKFTDASGIDDAWQVNHFGHISIDAYGDADADGFSNLEEYALGTEPTQGNVASPSFSPVGGNYSSAQNVAVFYPTLGATIHYTLNGNEPTESDATIASGSTVAVNQSATLKARAWKPDWTPSDTESQSYYIGSNPQNQPPTIAILPPTGTSFSASDDVEIFVEADDTDGTIGKVQLYRGDYKIAETTDRVLRYLLNNIPAGNYTFTGKAIDNSGAVVVSSPITITIGAPALTVALVGTQPFLTASPGTLLGNIIGLNPGALTSLTLNNSPIPPRTGDFPIEVNLVEGANTFTLAATDDQSRSGGATTTVYLDSTAPVVSITTPVNNSSFGTDRVNVSGTFTEANLNCVVVNGVPAFVSGGTFEALNVPLTEGENTITATAEDISGNTGTATITVSGGATPVDPVQLTASPVGGFVPLQVTFTPQSAAPGTLQQVIYDLKGDNQQFITRTDLSPLNHAYDTPGEYFPVVTIVTSDGRFSSPGGWNGGLDRIRINVQAPPQQVGNAISVTDPVDLRWINGYLYVLSRQGAKVTQFDQNGNTIRSLNHIGGGGSGAPTGLDVDSSGTVYVALNNTHRVAKLLPSGSSFTVDTTFGVSGYIGNGTPGSGNGQLNLPYDVALTPDGEEIAVSDSGNHRIQRFTKDGVFIEAFGQQGSGVVQFNSPKGLAYDSGGYLYIVDSGNNRIALTLSSEPSGASGAAGTALGQLQSALNVAIGGRGIYVADTGNNRVQFFDPVRSGHGLLPTPFIPRGAIASQLGLSQPSSVAVGTDFLQEKVYIADTANNRVVLVSLPSESPEAVWTAMKQQLLTGNIDGAVSYFSASSGERYRQSFLSIGATDLVPLISDIPTLIPVFIENETAQYRFEQVLSGRTLSFPIDFVKENGIWKIVEF